MSPKSELEQFLGSTRDSGKLDAEGAFTLADASAVKKLARFQLARESSWVLKVVQAAVCANAPTIRVNQTRTTTLFAFRVGPEFPIGDLGKNILAPISKASTAIEHLALALRAVGIGSSRPFLLVLERDGAVSSLSWDGERLASETKSDNLAVSGLLKLEVAFPTGKRNKLVGWLRGTADITAAEYQEFINYAEVCPIPLELDGRRVDTLRAPHPEKKGQSAFLAIDWQAGEAPSLRLPRGLDLKCRHRLSLDNPVYEPHHDGGSVMCVVKVRYNFALTGRLPYLRKGAQESLFRKSYLSWVKDGVVTDREVLEYPPSPISIELYLPVDGLPSDISGEKVIPGAKRTARLNSIIDWLRETIETLIRAIQYKDPEEFKLSLFIFGTAAVMPVLASPFLGPGGLLMSPIGLAAMGQAKFLNTIHQNALDSLKEFKQNLHDFSY